jgi:hypothetical protein
MLESLSQNVAALSMRAASTAAMTVFHSVRGPKFKRTPCIVSCMDLSVRPILLNSSIAFFAPEACPSQWISCHSRSGSLPTTMSQEESFGDTGYG